MESESLKDLHSRRIQKNLSQLLKSDEISEAEYHNLAKDEKLCSAALAHIPNCLHPLSRCTDEEYEAINCKFRDIIRAYAFALRYCQARQMEYSSEVFQKSMKMQSEENYKLLLQAVFKIFDNLRYNMRAHYYFITNAVVYPILAEEMKRTEAIGLLKVRLVLFRLISSSCVFFSSCVRCAAMTASFDDYFNSTSRKDLRWNLLPI